VEQEGYVTYREDGKTLRESMAFLEELAKQMREPISDKAEEPER
jgi:hypothetical protein